MKKIILFTIATAMFILLQAWSSPVKSTCSSYNETYWVYDFHAYGDQLLGWGNAYSLTDMTSEGCKITLSIKADASESCTYSWSKDFNDDSSDLNSTSLNNVQLPSGANYTATIKCESGCVYDYYLALDVKFVWSKSLSSTAYNASAELGFPTKALCPTQSFAIEREDVLAIYDDNGRIASSALR